MAYLRNYDYRCLDGHIFERMVETDVPVQHCVCGQPAVVIWTQFPGTTQNSDAQRFDPVTVFKKQDGTYCLPGRSNQPTPEGMQRVELTTTQAVRRFEKEENQRIKDKNSERLEREDRNYSRTKKYKRDILRQQMDGRLPITRRDNGQSVHHPFTAAGRKFAEFAMKKSDSRPSLSQQASRFEPNFHVEAFSKDASNRAPHNDVDTGLRDRK